DASDRFGVAARMRWRPHRLFGLVVPGGWLVAVVAALQTGLAALRRHRAARRTDVCMTGARKAILASALGLLLSAALGLATAPTAFAQSFNYNPRPPKPPVTQRPANDGQMLVQA